MNKKWYILIIFLIIILLISSFGLYLNFKYKVINRAQNISLDDMESKIESSDEFDISKMQNIDTDFASSIFLIDKEKIKGITGKAPLVNTKSSMYVIIQANSEDLQDIKLALDSYAIELEKDWSNYLPDQYELVKNRKVGIIKNYVYMIISENPDKVENLIK